MVVTDLPFLLAPKLDLKPKKKAVVAGKEARIENVIAAPPPIAQPKEPSVAAVGAGAGGAGAAGGGKGAAVVMPASAVVPKDEIGKTTAAAGAGTALAPAGSVVPIDEASGEGGSSWWIWLLVGVAVAGAAAGGTALAVSQSGGGEGNLKIRW